MKSCYDLQFQPRTSSTGTHLPFPEVLKEERKKNTETGEGLKEVGLMLERQNNDTPIPRNTHSHRASSVVVKGSSKQGNLQCGTNISY